MNNTPTPAAVIHLRAFIAYCEGQAPSANPFTLIPYAAAITAGIPFSITFSHEGNDWAIFIAGDCSPHDTIALEQAGVIDDADDERQEIAGGFNYSAHVAELEAGIPAAVNALENAFSLPSTCAAETFEETLGKFAERAINHGNGDSLRQLVATLNSHLNPSE